MATNADREDPPSVKSDQPEPVTAGSRVIPKLLLLLGLALLVVGVVWLVNGVRSPVAARATRLLPFGLGFAGSPTLPASEFETARLNGENTIIQLDARAIQARHLADGLEFAAFAVTTLLTLLAGSLGLVSDSGQEAAKGAVAELTAKAKRSRARKTISWSRRGMVAIGILSACASASTAAASKLRARGDQDFRTADHVRATVDEKRAAIDAATQEREARGLLSELLREIAKAKP